MSDSSMPASAQEALDVLRNLPPLADVGISFTALGPGQDGALEGYLLGTTKPAQAALAGIAETTRERVLNSNLIAYGPAVLVPPQHVMHVAQEGAATLSQIQDTVLAGDNAPFDAKADYAQNVTMVAARFTTESHEVATFYRVSDPLLRFTKSKVLGLIQRGNQYDRMEPTDVLLMRAEFDVVVVRGHAFFFKKPTFERAFGFYAELKAASAATFDRVTAGLKIRGLDELKKACTSQTQMMAKMASIQRSMEDDAAYAASMTMANLITHIEQHPHVRIDIVGSGNNRELVFDPALERRFQILKLLDDDFLRSVLTSREYEAGSKVPTPSP